MRIALIAMSGIRACDEELLRLGLTLPGFVERSQTIASLPSLGLLTLAAMTPSEHEVSYFEVRDWPDDKPTNFDFDLVALSTCSAQVYEAYDIADRFREHGVPVVIGGLHATSLPDEAGEHADAVAIGEGEIVWPRILADLEQGRLQSRYQSQPDEFDLGETPLPRYDLLDLDRYNRLTIQTSRGCPFRCEFCANTNLLTSRYKQKPADRVLAELDHICNLWDHPFIEFADDNSFVNRAYWKSLLPRLAERRVRWFTETDISVGEDEELLKLMRESGCVEVLIGLESPNATGLNHLELQTNWKARYQPRYTELIERIQSCGIRVNGCFIVGLDGHGPDIFDDIFRFVANLELYDVQVTLPTPFPGTPFYERLRRSGRLFEERAWQKCTLFDLMFEPQQMTADELRDGFHSLVSRLYSNEFTAWRRRQFNKTWRRRA